MKMPTMPWSKAAPAPTDADSEHPEKEISRTHNATGISALLTRLVVVAFFGLVVFGLLCSVAALGLVLVTTQQQSTAPEKEKPSYATQAGQFGLAFVTSWLGSSRDDHSQLDPYLVGTSVTLPAKARPYRDAAVVAAEENSEGLYRVVVAATIQESVLSGNKAVIKWPRRYWQVTVATSAGGSQQSVVGWPALVAAPQPLQAPLTLAYPSQVTPTDPVSQTLTGFFAAYLAGTTDLNRFISPGSSLSALVPPISGTPQVSDVRSTSAPAEKPADGAKLHVLATVVLNASGTDPGTATTYALTLTARAGRWEVAAIDAAPQLGGAPKNSLPTPSSIPTTK